MKKVFRVKLNWHGEIYEFTTITTRSDIAARNAIFKLAQKLGRDLYFVRQHFYDEKKITVQQISAK